MENQEVKVTWAAMPRKDQVLILFFLRYAETTVRVSIVTYIYYQLLSLEPTLPSGEIIRQAAYLQTAFTISQSVSALFLGRMADSPRWGRKPVLLMGLTVISVACFAFITSFKQALALRIAEGLVNGNIATIRAMVSEVVSDKRFQPRAFLLLPVSFSLAAVISPIVAGQLANLPGRFPNSYGHVEFLKNWPYALPALVNAALMLLALVVVFLFLEETLAPLRGHYDPGLALSKKMLSMVKFRGRHLDDSYHAVDEASSEEEAAPMVELQDSPGCRTPPEDDEEEEEEEKAEQKDQKEMKPKQVNILPLKRVFTRSFVITLLAYCLQEWHLTWYNTLWTSFLSDPVQPSNQRHLPFFFGGGAGMQASEISWSMSIVGVIGLPAQLILFPRMVQRVGTLRTWRLWTPLFPLTYLLTPYIAVMPSTTPASQGKHGFVVWVLIVLVQVMFTACSVFVPPAQLILTNSSSPHPSALARTHSVAWVATGVVRAVSSAISGIVYSYGSAHNLTGLAWWSMGATGVAACVVGQFMKEGNGHEIWLPGDDEEGS